MSESSHNFSHNITRQTSDEMTEFADASRTGGGLFWAGVSVAIIWWGSAGFGLYRLFVSSTVSQMSPELLILAAGFAILPGLILIFAGVMARQNKRTHAANLLLLKASEALLSPAKTAAGDIITLAEATRRSTALVNQSSTAALGALQSMSDAVADERLRAESVSYAMADNARDLTQRLSEERMALEKLSHSLNEQATIMGKTLPRQAEAIKDATKLASHDVSQADEVLAKRIEQLKDTSSTLATRLIDLDAVARDAAKRTDALQTAIQRIEDKLNQSYKTVETAERASKMAVDAANQTSHSLQTAVSVALDQARDANREIVETTRLIQEAAVGAMEALRKTGAQAASAAARVQEQSLGIAGQLDATERPQNLTLMSPQELSELMKTPEPESINNKTMNGFGNGLGQTQPSDLPLGEARTSLNASLMSSTPRPLKSGHVDIQEIDPIAETRPEALEEDLFETRSPNEDSDTRMQTSGFEQETEPPVIKTQSHHPSSLSVSALELGSDASPIYLKDRYSSGSAPSGPPPDWRDIIADFDAAPDAPGQIENRQDDTDVRTYGYKNLHDTQAASHREDNAQAMILRLVNSGIPLEKAFRSRDKRKIAAAIEDQQARRRAIRNAAGGEVDRVMVRLSKDEKLMNLAQEFVSAEEVEALQALKDTGSSGRHASQRLSAYLLVDAALEPILRS